jgi:superfamily II DNA or RNA helicase
MTETLHLRDYQLECMDLVRAAWYNTQRPAVVLPTGAGKTVVFSHLAAEWLEREQTRVVVLVHRDELADQAIAKMRAVAPHLEIGKVKAADNEVHADVMVCSVQTLARQNRLDWLVNSQEMIGGSRPIGMVIVDECHHAAATSYLKILQALGCYDRGEENAYGQWEGTRAVGFTATMVRGDGVGLGNVWEEITYTKTTLWMISRGYLVDVRGRTVDLELDLSKVKTSGGDYQAKSLGSAMVEAGAPEAIAETIRRHAAGRRPIVFCPDVQSTWATVDALDRAGIPSEPVTGETSREDRLKIYGQYRRGEIRALVNCMVLTEGADFPWADCAVIARPTKSAGLYIQMVGRVLRPWPGKTDALVLNVVGEGGALATLIDLDPGLVTPPSTGESLAEAYARQEERADQTISSNNLLFALRYRDVDLFASSSHAWLRTPGGVMFLSRGDGEIFLWPDEDETWAVCYSSSRPAPWQRLHRGLSLGMAMAWAETEAGASAFALSAKDKRWRSSPAEPRHIGKAKSIGCAVGESPTKGEVSDLISVSMASRKFDERMKRVRV